MRLSTHFTLQELTVTGTGLPNIPNAIELEYLRALCGSILQPLRESVNAPIVVSSGYRSQAVNRAVGGAANSQHTLGQAADFTVAGMSTRQTVERIQFLKLPFDQVIEEFGRWVHVSIGPKHRRQVLTARRVDGRTRYLAGLV